MFEKVLVPLDFSVYSQKILDHINEIPGIKEVVLLHVVDATRPLKLEWKNEKPLVKDAQVFMAEKKQFLENLGLKVHVNVDVIVNAITQGTISHAILEIADTEDVSLIVLGARGINPIQELLLGSVSSFIIRHAKTNVLIMHFPPASVKEAKYHHASRQKLFSKVLVPSDFSRPANSALAFIKTITGINEVVLLHVVNRAESPSEIDMFTKDAEQRFEVVKRDFEKTGVHVQIRVRVGDPTEMILSVAEEEDISLIAISAFGTDWLRDMILGSTTFTVVRRTRKPVLILRAGKETGIG